ncbi:MAG: hypothetical protein P8Y45_24010 [Exilibacterium sp.]
MIQLGDLWIGNGGVLVFSIGGAVVIIIPHGMYIGVSTPTRLRKVDAVAHFDSLSSFYPSIL